MSVRTFVSSLLWRCFLEKLHDRQGIVEHNIVTTLDGTDYPGGIIFQAVVKLFERTWGLRLPDCKNKHPSLDLKMITLQPNILYQGSERMRSAFLVEPSTVIAFSVPSAYSFSEPLAACVPTARTESR